MHCVALPLPLLHSRYGWIQPVLNPLSLRLSVICRIVAEMSTNRNLLPIKFFIYFTFFRVCVWFVSSMNPIRAIARLPCSSLHSLEWVPAETPENKNPRKPVKQTTHLGEKRKKNQRGLSAFSNLQRLHYIRLEKQMNCKWRLIDRAWFHQSMNNHLSINEPLLG